jgi:heat shock protein HtpX
MLDTAILLSVMTAILLAIGWLIGGIWGITIAIILSIVINFLSYWYSDKIVLRMYNAKPTKNILLEDMVKELSRDAGIPTPKIYMIETSESIPNAFATGRDPKHSVIAVTSGLMNLEKEEIMAVIAHEMGHIKNRDVMVASMAAAIAGAISYVAQMAYWSMFLGSGRREGGSSILLMVAIAILAPIAALIVRMVISRKREYGADYSSAVITKNPKSLASALRKISGVSKEKTIKGPAATSHLWVVNPFKGNWFSNLFSTHPPIENRIKKLMEMHGEEIE